MAKWGEGDPRWIVEERADATNVNNWHWSEKNATPWSKQRLPELLENIKIEDGPIVVTLDKLKKCEGEATANNRKAKLIFLFEWEIKIGFVARVTGTELEYKGDLVIPNLSDENEADEVDVETTIDTKGPHDAQIRQMLNKKGTKAIQDQLATYIKELKEEFSKGIILPTGTVKPQVVTKGKTATSVDKKSFHNTVVTEGSSNGGKAVFEMKSVSVSDNYKVRPEELFEVFQDVNRVRAWANGNVDWDFREGGSFALFGGNVTGRFTKIDPNQCVTMNWRLKAYPDDHHAEIQLNMKDTGEGTLFEINAQRVPAHMAEQTQNGLDRYYVQSIARTFGFSARF